MGKKKEKTINVTIIVPCYNSEKTIESCLGSLLQQKTKLSFEVIVVDSSADSTPSLVKEKFPSVKLIHLDQQTYPGAGRNIGAKEAQGKYLAFIDSDCTADENWLEKGITSVQQGYALVGGSVVNANPTVVSWADYFLTFNEFLPSMPRREVLFMPSCNLFLEKNVFENIGSFREDILAGEDTLFCHKATQNYRLLFFPEIRVRHTNREMLSQFFRHHTNFGKHAAYVRKIANIPGRRIVQNPLFFFAVPLLRTGKITWRMFRYNAAFLPSFVTTFPLFFLGVLAWSYGFVKEAIESQSFYRGL